NVPLSNAVVCVMGRVGRFTGLASLMSAQSFAIVFSSKPGAWNTKVDDTLVAFELCRSTTPAVAVIEVFAPVPATQCAAVRTTWRLYSAPPQPIDSRTTQGNSPWAARPPPTTRGVGGSVVACAAKGATAAAVTVRVANVPAAVSQPTRCRLRARIISTPGTKWRSGNDSGQCIPSDGKCP